MRALSCATIAAVLVWVCAQRPADAQAPTSLTAEARPGVSIAARSTTASPATTVFGFVWNANNEPIAFAKVRLRNVTTGRADAETNAADNGEFTFQSLEGGTYVIEYVDQSGQVLAVGHVFSVAPGETVATFIRLAGRRPWFAALLGDAGNAAATAIASAASLGVTALAPASRPVSAEF